MFSGKKEKILQEEIAAVREENRRQKKVLQEVLANKDEIREQFIGLTEARVSMEKKLGEMEENLSGVSELVTQSKTAADDVHNTVMGVNNAVESFDASHTVFLGQLKKQNEKMAELMEQQRTLQPHAQSITEIHANLSASNTAIADEAAKMGEYAKTMGVLALNAAIEAGRLGDAGLGFISAAEEVRAFSEKYEASVKEVIESQKAAMQQIADLEKQVGQLQASLKEQTVSTGKLYSNSVQTISSYEAGQIDLRSSISFDTVARADALQQTGSEFMRVYKELGQQLASAMEDCTRQRDLEYELEKNCGNMQDTAENV